MASRWADLAATYGNRHGLPAALILALIDLESGGDPGHVNPSSNATGLMQVTKIALDDYNQRHGKSLRLVDVKDPALNVAIGTELLGRIAKSYRENHGLRIDWRSRPFVELVVFGWNAGYSEKAGVGRVLHELKKEGRPLTAAGVYEKAKTMGVNISPYLKIPQRLQWSQAVTSRFLGKPPVSNGKRKKTNWTRVFAWTAGVAGIAGLTWWAVSRVRQKTPPALPPAVAPPPVVAGLPNYGAPAVVVIKGGT